MTSGKGDPHYPGWFVSVCDLDNVEYNSPPGHVRTLIKPLYPPRTKTYDSVATLGDDDAIGLTCSTDAARRWGKGKEVLPFPSFEAAAEAVKTGVATAMLVPGAYPLIRRFIMDIGLTAKETFILNIPPLVLVGLTANIPSSVDVIFHHPATDALLPDIGVTFRENKHCTSNTAVCKKLLNFEGLAIAVTNKLCADYYEVVIYKTLRVAVAMPWTVFVRN